MQPTGETGLTEDFLMPIPSLSSITSPGIVYYSFTRDTPEDYPIASFQCSLKFVSKEVDPSTGEPEEEGYEDEYQLEDTELSAADYIVPTYVTFASEWDRLRGGVSITETFALPAMESLKGKAPAVRSVAEQSPLTIVLCSCVRLDHRDSQYATTGWERRPTVAKRAYAAAVWPCRRWRRQGTCAVPDDLFEGPGRCARVGCPRRKAGVGEPGCCRHRVENPDFVMSISYILFPVDIADFFTWTDVDGRGRDRREGRPMRHGQTHSSPAIG